VASSFTHGKVVIHCSLCVVIALCLKTACTPLCMNGQFVIVDVVTGCFDAASTLGNGSGPLAKLSQVVGWVGGMLSTRKPGELTVGTCGREGGL
jgi:hypothetical protein